MFLHVRFETGLGLFHQSLLPRDSLHLLGVPRIALIQLRKLLLQLLQVINVLVHLVTMGTHRATLFPCHLLHLLHSDPTRSGVFLAQRRLDI